MPINYIEAIAFCEWMEVGFNTFYTFRGGEVGWIYAQVLRCLCHLMGTTCVSVYPYQLGHDNEEAIESGAFWFYRKLGFRPGRPELAKTGGTRRTQNRRRSQVWAGTGAPSTPGSGVMGWRTPAPNPLTERQPERCDALLPDTSSTNWPEVRLERGIVFPPATSACE